MRSTAGPGIRPSVPRATGANSPSDNREATAGACSSVPISASCRQRNALAAGVASEKSRAKPCDLPGRAGSRRRHSGPSCRHGGPVVLQRPTADAHRHSGIAQQRAERRPRRRGRRPSRRRPGQARAIEKEKTASSIAVCWSCCVPLPCATPMCRCHYSQEQRSGCQPFGVFCGFFVAGRLLGRKLCCRPACGSTTATPTPEMPIDRPSPCCR